MQEEMRLNKYLSDAGFCSRREADRLIEQGRIFVNGIPAAMGQKVTTEDVIMADNKVISSQNKRVVIAFNKPVGVECTSDLGNPDNIIDFIKYPVRIYPIGRLDKKSQGLILLTNDGSLVNNILKASNYHEKEYVVTVDKKITEDFIGSMSKGVRIPTEGFIKKGKISSNLPTQMTRPCIVEKINNHTFRIILTQGLNRQIRRMCAVFGYEVQKLKRIRIMNISLGNLPIGTYREVVGEELKELYNNFDDEVSDNGQA